MSDTTYADPPPADPAPAPGPSAEEIQAFLDQLKKDADAYIRDWMSARVPPWAREKFEEMYPAPEPAEEL